MVRGLPDIIACIGGRFVAIEVKTSKDRQRQQQKQIEMLVRKAGGLYLLCYSLEDALLTLSRFGLMESSIQQQLPLSEVKE